MSSLSIPQEAQALNAYDDMSFIKEDHSHQMHPNDPTRVAVFPAEKDRSTNFEPFHIETRNFHISTPPPTPLQLFQLFFLFPLLRDGFNILKAGSRGLRKIMLLIAGNTQ